MVAIRGSQYNNAFKHNCIDFTSTLYLHNTTQKYQNNWFITSPILVCFEKKAVSDFYDLASHSHINQNLLP